MTTQEQIDSAKSLCESIQADEIIKDAYVDDWGKYGNFSLIVIPKKADRYSTKRILAIINRCLLHAKVPAHVRSIYGPDPVYRTHYDPDMKRTHRKVIGYSRQYWMVDLDYYTYDEASNRFSCQVA